jgi:hypothetical protein
LCGRGGEDLRDIAGRRSLLYSAQGHVTGGL